MATTCGTRARRKIGGNMATLKRRSRHSRAGKVFTDTVLTPEQYRALKRSQKKARRA